MARVPVSDAPIASRPIDPSYQRVDPSAAAFGSLQAQGAIGAGQDLEGIGDKLGARAIAAQQFDNERALKQADVSLADKIRTITYGDGTPQNRGYYALQGDDAVAQATPTMAAIKQAHADVTATLPNARTQEIFEQAGQSRVVSEQEGVSRFLDVQRRKADDGASLARMDSAVSDAATRWNEPDQLAKSRAIIAGEVGDFAARNGLGDDAKDHLLREQNTKLLGNVIKSAGRVDFASAQKILSDNQDWLPGTALAAIDREMKTDGEFAQRQQEHALLMDDRAKAKAATAAFDKYISGAIDPQNPNGIDLHAVANDPQLAAHPQLKKELFAFQAAQDKGEAPSRVSAATLSDLYPRFYLPDGDPNKIGDERQLDQYFMDHKLNRTDLTWARKEVADQRTPDGSRLGQEVSKLVNAATKQIQGSTAAGLPDPDRAMNAYLYQQMVSETISTARQNKEDPREYLNAASPKYLGSAKVLTQYQRSFQDILADTVKSLSRPSGAAVGGQAEVPAAPQYKSADDVVSAYKSKRITRDQASQILHDKGWAQ